jgi:hypothetical protein
VAAAWGPIEFSATEAAVILAVFGLVPPFVVAALGSIVHAFVRVRRGEAAGLGRLFLRWFGWCTLGWVGSWLLAAMFA